jgi:hypothetical protein
MYPFQRTPVQGGKMTKPLFLSVLAVAALTLAACGLPFSAAPTPTPEVFIPINQAIPDYGLMLGQVHIQIAGATLSNGFPAGCTGAAPCTPANSGARILSVTFSPRDLPEGDMLPYKDMPEVRVALEGGATVAYSLTLFDNASQSLTLGFQVPADAQTFGLRWGDLPEIPINVSVLQ